LTEILARAGYTTAAFTEDAMLSAGSGFSRGFDVYRENREALQLAGSSQQTIGEGTAWLERHAREIFFLFLHTYEAHSPYEPSERQLAAFPKAPDESKGEAGRWQEVRRKYAAEVRVADDALGKLFERMAELDVLDETIVVITSDHGEELGEHGALGHAKTLFDEVLRVPLLLRAPDLIPAGAVVEEQVSLVDVVPTMLELVGLPPPGPMHGQSLVRVMRGEEDPDPVRFAEGLSGDAARTRMVTARRRDRKWIWRDDDPRHIELYDLEGDPKEEKPVDDSERQAEGAALRARYQALAGGRTRHPESDQRPIDPETARKLEALGYVE
jgi:arylsulfatase A-like enzyme